MPDHSWFEAVSVTVCVDAAAACNDRYYYWLFEVGAKTVTEGPSIRLAKPG